MSFKLTQFGTVYLPTYNPVTPVGTAPSAAQLVRTLDGFYDGYGAAQAPITLPYDLLFQLTALAESDTELQATVNALKALRGKRAALYRVLTSGASHWCYARLNQVPAERRPGMLTHQPLDFVFQVLSQWYGTLHADRFTLDSSPKACVVTNGGNALVTNGIVTLTAGSAAITAVTVSCGNCEWSYTGTIAAGESLVVDSGQMSVLNNAVDDYANFNRTANHASAVWLELVDYNNVNTLTVTLTGGSTDSTLQVDFSNGWE